MKIAAFAALACAPAIVFAAMLKARVDNRIAVFIPDGETLDQLCAEWTSTCTETVTASGAEGAQASIFCNAAPAIYEKVSANVFCTDSAGENFTDAEISQLGLEKAH